MSFKNPVIETYRGFPIRKYPKVQLRISVQQMKAIIDVRLDTGVSERRAIKKLNILCSSDSPIQIVKSEYAKGH